MVQLWENLQILGPAFAVIWALTILLTLWRPQRYFNSILLMVDSRVPAVLHIPMRSF